MGRNVFSVQSVTSAGLSPGGPAGAGGFGGAAEGRTFRRRLHEPDGSEVGKWRSGE